MRESSGMVPHKSDRDFLASISSPLPGIVVFVVLQ